MKLPFMNKDPTSISPPLTDLSNTPGSNGSNHEKEKEKRRSSSFDEGRVPWVTWRSLTLGAFVSIGGIIFGYDTGQISGFLEMKNYKQRYGQLRDGEYTFSNVRSGLIVSMVSLHNIPLIGYPGWLKRERGNVLGLVEGQLVDGMDGHG